MKVLMYAPIFPPAIGGPSTQAHSLCGALDAHGERVVVVTVGERFECTSPDGYPVYRYPWSYTRTPLDKALRWAVFPWYFWRILKKENPDIVHCHAVSILSFMAGWIAQKMGIGTVIKFAGDWVWETLSTSGVKAKDFNDLRSRSRFARFLWVIEKRGLSYFDRIWAPSEFRAQNVEQVQGHRHNVTVIYNALALPSGGYHEVRKGDPFIVVAANRFIPHKRIPALVEAFAKATHSDEQLILIGEGQEGVTRETKDAIETLRLEERVLLTGRLEIEKVYEYFKIGSIYVSNSLEEGFPNVFVEAMHFGLPIISTDVGGCHEIVRDGETGFLIDPMDQEALVRKIETLAGDLELRNRMAKAAYEHSRQYELATVLDQFLDLYRSVLNR